jgi:hypothetical protein
MHDRLFSRLDDDVTMTSNSPKKPPPPPSSAFSRPAAFSGGLFGIVPDSRTGGSRDPMAMGESPPDRGGDVETLDDDDESIVRGTRGGASGGWSPSPLRHQRDSTAPAAFSFEDSPIKRGQMSESRSLGGTLGARRAKRPNSMFDASVSGKGGMGASRSLRDGRLFSGVDLMDDSEEGEPAVGGGTRGGAVSDSDDDDDDEGDVRPSLKPLSFPSFPSISPSPFLAQSTTSNSGSSSNSRQRALTEQDLNAPPFSSKKNNNNAFFSSSSCSTFPSNTSDNIDITSSVFLSPSTPLLSRSVRFDALKSASKPNFLSASASLAPSAHNHNSHLLSSKKATSLDNLHFRENSAPSASSFASLSKPAGTMTRTRRSSLLSGSNAGAKGHKRVNSNEQSPFNIGLTSLSTQPPALSRSNGLKSGLAQAPSALGSSSSSSSVGSSSSSANRPTPSSSQQHLQTSTSLTHLNASSSSQPNPNLNVQADPSLNRSAPASLGPPKFPSNDTVPFNDAKPLLAAFQAKSSLARKFRPRDSGVALDDFDSPRPSLGSSLSSLTTSPLLTKKAHSLPHLNISTSSASPASFNGLPAGLELATPSCTAPPGHGWPTAPGSVGGSSLTSSIGHGAFDFLGGEAAQALADAVASQQASGSKVMPDTPVKKSSFNLGGSISKASGSGLNSSMGVSHPHPLSLSMQAASPDSSSPLNSAAPSPYRPHHSTSILARSHRPSANKPPHLQIPSASTTTSSRIPVPTTGSTRLRSVSSAATNPASPLFHVQVNGSSPDSRASSPAETEVDSPTVLRKGGVKALGASSNDGNVGAGKSPALLSGKPDPSRTSMLRRTSSGVGSLSGSSSSESEGGSSSRHRGTPTRGGLTRSRSPLDSSLSSPTYLADQTLLHSGRALPASNLPRRALPSLSATSSLNSPTRHRSTTTVTSSSSHEPESTPPLSSSPLLHSRLSLPSIPVPNAAPTRRLHHRASVPTRSPRSPQTEDTFNVRFNVLAMIGQGAFSQVFAVQERDKEGSDGVWAVKRTKGVFEGVKDRFVHLSFFVTLPIFQQLTHLARFPSYTVYDISKKSTSCARFPLPNLTLTSFTSPTHGSRTTSSSSRPSSAPCPTFPCSSPPMPLTKLAHGRSFGSSQTFVHFFFRLCLFPSSCCMLTLPSFPNMFASQGLHHIHSRNILHLDLKPANVLVTSTGSLKIGDFGLSTRFPRVDAATILRGAGLGGEVAPGNGGIDKGWEREGDRDYMALETLRGVFGKPADIFSYVLALLRSLLLFQLRHSLISIPLTFLSAQVRTPHS